MMKASKKAAMAKRNLVWKTTDSKNQKMFFQEIALGKEKTPAGVARLQFGLEMGTYKKKVTHERS